MSVQPGERGVCWLLGPRLPGSAAAPHVLLRGLELWLLVFSDNAHDVGTLNSWLRRDTVRIDARDSSSASLLCLGGFPSPLESPVLNLSSCRARHFNHRFSTVPLL